MSTLYRTLAHALLFLVAGCVSSESAGPKTEAAGTPRDAVTLHLEVEDELTGSGLAVREDVVVPRGTVALEAMRTVIEVHRSEAGWVEVIGGVRPDPASYYWTLYVDGEYSQVGIESLVLDDDTAVLWKVTALPDWALEESD